MFTDPVRSIDGLHYPSSNHCNVVETGYIHEEQKAYEIAMVEMPNAVINPRAMMVLVTVLVPAFNSGWNISILPIRRMHPQRISG